MINTLINPNDVDKAYGNLAHAIILQAVQDYRRLLRGKLIPDNITEKVNIKECEDFFLSDWFYTLTNVDGQTIINKLRREYQNECKANSSNTKPH